MDNYLGNSYEPALWLVHRHHILVVLVSAVAVGYNNLRQVLEGAGK
jgi:hypothetical protein